jgi:membrane fusion protein, macrolide-specific efflux system
MKGHRQGRSWRHSIFLGALAVVAAGIGVLAISQLGVPSSSARTTTEVVSAEDGVVQKTVSGTGNVAAGTDDEVNFATSGTLKRVYVHEGEHVTKGQILATLDPTSAQLTMAEANETLSAAKATLADAEDGSSSSASTTTTGSSSEATTIQEDEIAVESDEEAIKNDELALAEATLRAPATGTIASLEDVFPGDSVQAGSSSGGSSPSSSSSSSSSGDSSGSSFAEIINTSTLTMTVAVSESDIGEVEVGQPATVTVDAIAGIELAAHVRAISADATDSSDVVSYEVTLKLDQTDSRVRSGMSASAKVIVAQASGVTVPNSAVSGSGSEGAVTLYEDGRRVPREVVAGLRGTTRTAIASGLTAGDELIVTQTLPSLGSTSSATAGTGSSGTLGGVSGLGAAGLGALASGGPAAGGSP